MNALMLMADAGSASGGFSIGELLKNSTATLKGWGGGLIMLLGVVMIIAATWQIAKGLMDQGRGQTNWFIVILLFLVGGAFLAGGWGFADKISKGGKKTIEELGTGTPTQAIYYNIDNYEKINNVPLK